MKQLHLHSVTDVTTNSSSEIYTFAHDNAISMAKKALAKILKSAGVKEEVDDVYSVQVRMTYCDDEGNELNAVANTDAELKKLNKTILGDNDDGTAHPDGVSVVAISKNGDEVDLTDLFSAVTYEETIYN
jgi:uncharacterized lipoprotein YehR (DUF1307 family)